MVVVKSVWKHSLKVKRVDYVKFQNIIVDLNYLLQSANFVIDMDEIQLTYEERKEMKLESSLNNKRLLLGSDEEDIDLKNKYD